MVDAIADNVEAFDGKETRIRCFLHIMNIVAGKNLIRQFDTATACAKDSKDDDDDEEKEILALAHELEVVPEAIDDRHGVSGDNQDEDDDLDGEELLDAVAELTDAEREEFETNSRPLKLLLAKVSQVLGDISADGHAEYLTMGIRSGRLHRRSSPRRQGSFRPGRNAVDFMSFRSVCFRGTYAHAGIRLTICWR